MTATRQQGAASGHEVAEAEKLIGDAIGKLMEFWGFRKTLGRIWALLYLESEPLSAADIGSRLKLAAGTVSMSVNELLQWGAIRKVYREGERRDFYEAESDLWRLITGVLRARERRLLTETKEALGLAQAALRTMPGDDARAQLKLQRVQLLEQLTDLATGLLDQLLDSAKIDVSPFLKLIGNRRG